MSDYDRLTNKVPVNPYLKFTSSLQRRSCRRNRGVVAFASGPTCCGFEVGKSSFPSHVESSRVNCARQNIANISSLQHSVCWLPRFSGGLAES